VIAQITGLFHSSRSVAIPFGSELARDGGVSGTIIVDWTAAIASKLAPTESSSAHKIIFFFHWTNHLTTGSKNHLPQNITCVILQPS
jgi:hypothetical protein